MTLSILNNSDFQIVVATWKDQADDLCLIRRIVFIEEQNVPEELEWDDLDESCQHLLALDNHMNLVSVQTNSLIYTDRLQLLHYLDTRGLERARLGFR